MASTTVPTKQVDPYLRAETVSSEIFEFNGVTLPPIFTGIQPGQGLNGEPMDYRVQVISVSRQQICALLQAIEDKHSDLHLPLTIVRKFLTNMESVQDHAQLGVLAAKSFIKGDSVGAAKARKNLEDVSKALGRWGCAHRLLLKL